MEKQSEVLLNIKGTRGSFGEDSTIFFTSDGILTEDAGKYTLKYSDEHGVDGNTHTEITVENGAVSMKKSGVESSEMYFRRNTPYASFYNTPFGKLDIMVFPTMVRTDMGLDNGRIELEYVMNIAGSQLVNKLQLSYKKPGETAGKDNLNENRMDGAFML